MVSKLTDEQKKFIDLSLALIAQGETSLIRLEGKPGTGKSYATSHLVGKIISKFTFKTICVSCISHAACDNMRNLLGELTKFNAVTVRTIASLLGQHKVGKGSNAGFSTGTGANVKMYDVLIFDEFSMIGESKMEKIIPNLKKGAVALFIGDSKQLPPVMDKKSMLTKIDLKPSDKPFQIHKVYGLPCYCGFLTQQQRQPGVLEKISSKARNELYYAEKTDCDFVNQGIAQGKVKLYFDEKSFLSEAKKQIRKKGAQKVCIFSYRNKIVNDWGRRLVKEIWQETKAEKINNYFAYGDTILINEGCYGKINRGEYLYLDKSQCEPLVFHGLPLVHFPSRYIYLVHPYEKAAYQKLETYYENGNASEDFKRNMALLMDSIVWGNYCFSRTVHSTQGITVEDAFLNLPDLKLCKSGRKNLLTVAYSRASSTMHILTDKI